MGPQHLVTFCN